MLLAFKSFRKRYVKKPPRKKWRIMMMLKAMSKGRTKKRLFRGYKIAFWGFAKKGCPENW